MRHFIIAISFMLLGANASAQGITITPKDYVMPQEAATDWIKKVVSPMLIRHYNNPKEIEAVKKRISLLSEGLSAGKFEYRAQPFFHPRNKTWLGHVDYDSVARRPILMIFVPALQAYQKTVSARMFEDMVVLTYTHELIHIEQGLNGEFPWRQFQRWNEVGMREEAAAYGKTIVQVIRPWVKLGRSLDPAMLALSAELAKVNDNYRDPRWVLAFSEYDKNP